MDSTLANATAIPDLAVSDLEVAKKFYQDTLGLKPVGEENGQALDFQAGNTVIHVYRSRFAGTTKTTSATFEVGERLDEVVQELKARGLQFEHYQLAGMKLTGDVHVGESSKVAWFKDPDGNILCLSGR